MAYTLLCGRHPFESIELPGRPNSRNSSLIASIMLDRLHFESNAWHNIESNAKDFLSLCLEPDYRRRISAAEAGGHPWIHGYACSSNTNKSIHSNFGTSAKNGDVIQGLSTVAESAATTSINGGDLPRISSSKSNSSRRVENRVVTHHNHYVGSSAAGAATGNSIRRTPSKDVSATATGNSIRHTASKDVSDHNSSVADTLIEPVNTAFSNNSLVRPPSPRPSPYRTSSQSRTRQLKRALQRLDIDGKGTTTVDRGNKSSYKSLTISTYYWNILS